MASTPQKSPQAYPGLGRIKDPDVRNVARILFDQLNALSGSPNDPGWKDDFHAGGNRLTTLADAEQPTDAVTYQQLLALTDPTRFQSALSIGGDAPLNITQLIGGGGATGTVTLGTHAQRLALPAATAGAGALFFETDRIALYVVNTAGTNWVLIVSSQRGSAAARPADLTSNDRGYNFFQVDTVAGNVAWQYNGTAWHYMLGVLRGNLSALPGASDSYEGAYFAAADFSRVYYCDGVNWMDAEGQPARYAIVFFDTAPDQNGWALCDGSGVTISQPNGTTTGFTTPDLVSATPFLRMNSSSGPGAAFGTTGTDYNSWELKPFVRL